MFPRYGNLSLQFQLFSQVYSTKSMVSRFGAMRVLDYLKANRAFGDISKKKALIDVNGIQVKAKFYSELSQAGSFYGFKFLGLDRLGLNNLAYQIEKNAVDDPWKRKLPRIPTSFSKEEFNIPVMSSLYVHPSFEVCKVLNFTLHGVLLESVDSGFGHVKIGEEIILDLYTSDGDTLNSIKGKLVRVVQEYDHRESKTVHHYAIMFTDMSNLVSFRYKKMLRIFLEKLKNKK